jgi:hypothetical protein
MGKSLETEWPHPKTGCLENKGVILIEIRATEALPELSNGANREMINKKESRSRTLEVLADRVFRKSRSEGSVETYIWGVRRFCEFIGEDPDGLIKKLANGKLVIEKLLNSWLDGLDKEGVSPRTQKLYFYSVKKFADMNLPDEPFNWKKVESPRTWATKCRLTSSSA